MKNKNPTLDLFAWFRQTLENVTGKTLPESPGGILRSLKAPAALLEWADEVENGVFSAKTGADGNYVPDLESRMRQTKRSSGQFYTPENFAGELLQLTQPDLSGLTLDPACGDGSFLLPAAEAMKNRNEAKCRLDKLFGFDIDSQALLICLGRLLEKCWGKGWPVLRHADFLTSDISEKFGLVLGNPPYKVNLNEELKNFLLGNYQTAEGEKDLYTFFIEKSVKLLEEKGQLLLLTSHTWLVNHHCQLIRSYVFKHRVENLFLLPPRFFVSAPGVLPAVLHLRRRHVEEDDMVTLHSGYDSELGWNKTYRARQTTFVAGNGLRQAIVPESLKNVFATMKQNFPCLGDLCRVGVGIQESLKREGQISKFVTDKAESERHRPVLKGRELSPWQINWEGRFIDYGPHLAYAGDVEVFCGEKILYQNIRNEKLKIRLVAAHDRQGYFPKNSLSFIVCKDKRLSLPYLEALLNSTLLNAWFSGHYHSFHITVSQVKTLPLALPTKALRTRIEKLVAELKAAGDEGAARTGSETLNLLICEAYFGSGKHQQLLRDCDFFLEQAAAL